MGPILHASRLIAGTGCKVVDGDNGLSDNLFGFPRWYKYLETSNFKDASGISSCKINIDFTQNPSQVWLIGLGVADILLRLAAVIAVGFVIYGGFQYMLSQGEPDRTAAAKNTIINAIVGLVIAILATTIVAFIGSKATGG